MKTQTVLSLFFSFFALIISAHAQTPETDIPALLKDAIRNGKGTKFFISDYTHIQTITTRATDKKGNVKENSETWEAYMPTLVKYNKRAVHWVRIKIKEDGKPLLAEKIEKERKNATEKLVEGEEKAAKLSAAPPPISDEDFVPDAKGAYFNLLINRMFRKSIELKIPVILQGFDFTPAQQEALNGRPTYVLNFKPKPDVAFAEGIEYYANLTGTMWIDVADRIVVKVEGWPVNTVERKTSPAIYYESARAPGDKWLPRLIRLNGREYKTFLGGLDREVEALLTDYQRFESEVKDVKLLDPKR